MNHLLVLLLAASAQGSEALDGSVVYFGDPHVHTGASGDGGSTDVGICPGSCGAVADLAALAQERGLDWLAVTDHVNGPCAAQPSDFATVLEEVLEAGRSGGVVTVPGAELAFFEEGVGPLGHRNLYLFGDDDDLAGLTLEDLRFDQASTGVSSCGQVFTWLAGLSHDLDQPVLLVPHHPAARAPMPVDWGCHDPAWEPAVEVYSRHGSSMGDGTDWDPQWSETVLESTVHAALGDHGHRLGFLGGTDGHDTLPGAVCQPDGVHRRHPYGGGLTAVVLDAGETLDRRAIHDALLDRRTFATSGPHLAASVRYKSGGAPLGRLGEDLVVPAAQPLQVSVAVPAVHDAVVTGVVAVTPEGETALAGQGAGAWSATLSSMPAWVYVRIEVDGSQWYDQPCDDGGDDDAEALWLSPSWWEEGPGDLDGDGQTWAQGDCHDGDPEVFLNAPERCGDGADGDCDGLADDEDPDCTGPSQRPDGPELQAGPEHDAWDGPREPSGTVAFAEPSEPARPGGCATAPRAWLAWLPLLLAVRRRR